MSKEQFAEWKIICNKVKKHFPKIDDGLFISPTILAQPELNDIIVSFKEQCNLVTLEKDKLYSTYINKNNKYAITTSIEILLSNPVDICSLKLECGGQPVQQWTIREPFTSIPCCFLTFPPYQNMQFIIMANTDCIASIVVNGSSFKSDIPAYKLLSILSDFEPVIFYPTNMKYINDVICPNVSGCIDYKQICRNYGIAAKWMQ
jgi:hypothetical protein